MVDRIFEFDLHVSNDSGEELFGTIGCDSLEGVDGSTFSIHDDRGLRGDFVFGDIGKLIE